MTLALTLILPVLVSPIIGYLVSLTRDHSNNTLFELISRTEK